jgi:hypothetical protein
MNNIKTNGENLKTSIEKLNKYSAQGYLFHSSPTGDISILEPKQADDASSTTSFNKDLAVFASDNACSTIIFGIMSHRKWENQTKPVEWSAGWYSRKDGYSFTVAKIPKSVKSQAEMKKGYVYVLGNETFKERSDTGRQWKSKVSVKPIDKIEVTLQDFSDMGGKIEWTD